MEWTSVIAESASAPGAAALRASSDIRSGGPVPSGMDTRRRGIGFGSCFESFEWLPIRRAGFVIGSRTDVGTCRGFAASDVRHHGIGFAARIRDDEALLRLLLLLLVISPAGNFVNTTRGGGPHPGRTCGAFARGCRTVK